jgi:hypothetical protein
MRSLESLWPTEEEKLSIEANAMDPVALLAVHQPMQFRRVNHLQARDHGDRVDEHELLKALLASSNDGRIIIPIKGESGSGKSHVIRWLQSQLSQQPDAADREVIVASKTMSLNNILETLLDRLPDTQNYNEIRNEMKAAAANDPKAIALTLGTELGLALDRKAKDATAIPRDQQTEDDKNYAAYGAMISATVRDPEFIKKVLYNPDDETSPFARVTRHVNTSDTHDDAHDFRPEDFDISAQLLDLVTHVNVNARNLVQMLGQERHKTMVATLLNLSLDSCIRILIERNLQGTPLSELFLRLRKALLRDDKELVILIEDFAVLTGMQGAILDALIHEAVVEGETCYCAIRSAIAYTTNQLVDRDTIISRAGATWYIEQTGDDEPTVLKRAENLIAAYWNAARWTLEELTKQRQQSKDAVWTPENFATRRLDLTPDEQEQVKAFGSSSVGYPLFPFTSLAIRQFVKAYSTVEGRPVYNPRKLVNHLVIQFIAPYKKLFLKQTFPPPNGFENAHAQVTSPDVLNAINATEPEEDQHRLRTLVAFWGNQPTSVGDAALIPKAIYDVFDLEQPDFGTPSPRPPGDDENGTKDKNGYKKEPKKKPKEPPQVATPWNDWLRELDRWQTDPNHLLPQVKANELRQWMAGAFLQSIPEDWPGTKILKLDNWDKDLARRIDLPASVGQGRLDQSKSKLTITLCSEEQWRQTDKALKVREYVQALIVRESTKTWPEEETTKCAAHYANFMAEHRDRVFAWVDEHRKFTQVYKDATLEDLVHTRLLAATVLGYTSQTQKETLDLIVREPGQPTSRDDTASEDWIALRNDAHDRFKKTGEDIRARLTARQGAGNSIFAFDTTKLRPIANKFVDKWDSSEREFTRFNHRVQRLMTTQRTHVTEWLTQSKTWFPTGKSLADIIEQIERTVDAVQTNTLADNEELTTLRRQITAVRTQSSNVTLDQLISNAQVATEEEPTSRTVLDALVKTKTTYRPVMDLMLTLFKTLTTHYKSVVKTLRQHQGLDDVAAYKIQQEKTRELLAQVKKTLTTDEDSTE